MLASLMLFIVENHWVLNFSMLSNRIVSMDLFIVSTNIWSISGSTKSSKLLHGFPRYAHLQSIHSRKNMWALILKRVCMGKGEWKPLISLAKLKQDNCCGRQVLDPCDISMGAVFAQSKRFRQLWTDCDCFLCSLLILFWIIYDPNGILWSYRFYWSSSRLY